MGLIINAEKTKLMVSDKDSAQMDTKVGNKNITSRGIYIFERGTYQKLIM